MWLEIVNLNDSAYCSTVAASALIPLFIEKFAEIFKKENLKIYRLEKKLCREIMNLLQDSGIFFFSKWNLPN